MKTKNNPQEIEFFNAIKANALDIVSVSIKENPKLLLAFDYNCFGGTPLTICSYENQKEMIALLLSKGADPNRRSDWWAGGWNPVQVALNHGHPEAAQFFVKHGAQVDVHEAAGLSLLGELKTILTSDPNQVSERGGDGCMPLHFAGSTEAIDVLLEFGADPNARDIDHHSTPAQYLASHSPDLSRYLFDKGADPDIFTAVLIGDEDRFESMISLDPSLLHQRINQTTFPPGSNPDVHNILTFIVGQEANLLHTAAIGKQLDMIRRLVASGIDVNSTGGYDDSTALHMSAWRDTVDVADTLIQLGADINKLSGSIHNNTPAGWAIVAGSANVFCHLIDNGATVLDYFEKDIRAGLAGEFMQYKKVDMENFRRMLGKLGE